MMTKIDMLRLLKAKVCECQKCPALVANRKQIVFDNINYEEDNQLAKSGNPNTKLLLLGEAPGKDEDLSGRPFVGRAGKLLDKTIELCGLKREDVYICNILKCRPPENRVPTDEEAKNCRPFLDLQIKVINPKIIVCLGATAAQKLLDTNTSIGRLREHWFEYNKAKVKATYHPAFILRSPGFEPKFQEDVMSAVKTLQV